MREDRLYLQRQALTDAGSRFAGPLLILFLWIARPTYFAFLARGDERRRCYATSETALLRFKPKIGGDAGDGLGADAADAG